jgi:hypothetical protein
MIWYDMILLDVDATEGRVVEFCEGGNKWRVVVVASGSDNNNKREVTKDVKGGLLDTK